MDEELEFTLQQAIEEHDRLNKQPFVDNIFKDVCDDYGILQWAMA